MLGIEVPQASEKSKKCFVYKIDFIFPWTYIFFHYRKIGET